MGARLVCRPVSLHVGLLVYKGQLKAVISQGPLEPHTTEAVRAAWCQGRLLHISQVAGFMAREAAKHALSNKVDQGK